MVGRCMKWFQMTRRFNPRPPRKVGATQFVEAVHSMTGCFNPRPPRKVGATKMVTYEGTPHYQFQSSPTPKGGRYLHLAVLPTREEAFQSSPTPKGGRYWEIGTEYGRACLVSILAHPERWALLVTDRDILAHRMEFQSSPTPKGGRYGWWQNALAYYQTFQSSPTPKGGRYLMDYLRKDKSECFNPRPPRKVGATYRSCSTRPRFSVSILAHPERWALP